MKLFLIVFIYSVASYAGGSYQKQKEDLAMIIKKGLDLSQEEYEGLKKIFNASSFLGQGNPAVTKHAMTEVQCLEKLKKENVSYENEKFRKICKSPYMSPIYDADKGKPEDANVCIDKFEFPNIPCKHPVVWVRAREAHLICQSIGKRLCDSHEWESACAGSLPLNNYAFDSLKELKTVGQKHNLLKNIHNKNRNIVWSYGPKQNHALCGTKSSKSEECNNALSSGKGVWESCGSNTYPVGAFPQCKSKIDVYDIHGNAAEHMNLPFSQSELTINGGTGYTEMKGSWFIFSSYSAHPDDCRWRAPYWHGSKVMSENSHRNYHLGFRCCKDIKKLDPL